MGCGASDENKAARNPITISQASGSPNKNDRTIDGLQSSPINRENISYNSVIPSSGNNPPNTSVPRFSPQSNPLHINTSKGEEDEEAVMEQPGRQLKRKNSTELKEKEFERSIMKETDLEPPKPNLEAISSPQQAALQSQDKPPLPRTTLKPLNINATKLDSLSSGTSKDSLSQPRKKSSPRTNSGSRFLPPIRRDPIKLEAVPQGFDFDLEMENEAGKNKKKVDTKQLVDELLRDMEEL